MKSYTEIDKCRGCGSRVFHPVVNLGKVPIVYFPKLNEANPPSVPLEVVRCGGFCKLVQLKHTTNPDLLWRHDYWYRSSNNSRMVEVLNEVVQEIQNRVRLEDGDIVVDTGSNDSTLLEQYPPGIVKVGFEPSNLAKETRSGLKIDLLINDFFHSKAQGFETLEGKVKVVTSIAMFYDVHNPHTFIEDIKKILRRDGVWCIQVAYLPKMLENGAFESCCHEHLCYYSIHALQRILQRHNLEIFDVQEVNINEGSIRVFVAHNRIRTVMPMVPIMLSKEEKCKLDEDWPYKAFRARMEDTRRQVKEAIDGMHGIVHCAGASTKGITMLHYFGLDKSRIEAVWEVQPGKWGRRMPGSDIPIISEQEGRKRNPEALMILPWTFAEGFVKREQEYLNGGGKIIIPLPVFRMIKNGVKR